MTRLSRLVRQAHLYLALFLTPWMLMYAISTIVMNHRDFFKVYYGGSLVQWEKEKEAVLAMQFSGDASAQVMAEQIMREMGFEGNFNANLSRDRTKLVIFRTDAVTPRRLTFTPADGKLFIEKQEFRGQPFLESLHRRRGFQSAFLLDDLWGATVDLVILAMVFWGLSGLWMWWELKPTRWLGACFALTGLALFIMFVFTI